MINDVLQVLKNLGIPDTEDLRINVSSHKNIDKLFEGLLALRDYWAKDEGIKQDEDTKQLCINKLFSEQESPEKSADMCIQVFREQEELFIIWNELDLCYTEEQEILQSINVCVRLNTPTTEIKTA